MSNNPYRDLAERFCATTLPATVCADPCASDPTYPHPRSGTNLLTVVEAEQVLRSVMEGYTPMQAVGGGKNPAYRGPRMDFGQALDALKEGSKVARAGWNGKDMFLFLVPGSSFAVNRAPLLGIYPEGTVIDYHPHIDMKTAQGYVVPWLASQTDVLAEDWTLIEAV